MPTTRSPALHAEVLTDAEQLQGLRPEWERLWRADPAATPFQSPHWLLPWWRHVGAGRLRTLALRDAEGELAGLAPLYVYTDAGGRRHLFPVGIGTTDDLAPLARPGWELRVAQAVLSQAAAWQDAWDVFAWPQLRQGAALLALRPDCVHPGEPNPVLPLPAAFPRATLANLRTCRNRAARAGQVTCDTAHAQDLPAYLGALFRLHARRWAERGQAGVLADAGVQSAHAEAAPLLHAAGLLRLHGLRLHGELVAVLYALAGRRSHAYYIAGFDPRHAFYGPGNLLLAHAIARAEAEGAQAFDFLRGAEAYKYRWGAVDQPTFALRLPACAGG